ncbi:MAG: hypothetical protein KDD94_13200, partial [Calditrichaeota bacterium]|nr:hypothetical protein [Calditrichota bacterium]
AFFIFILISCADKHELVVELDKDSNGNTEEQLFHFNFNGKITFPRTGFTKEIDIETDHFEVIKIKYSPIEKWNPIGPTDPLTNSRWGQQAILVRIIRKTAFFEPDETIFEQKISHFYNPVIAGITSQRANEIRLINQNLDSGLGNGQTNNLSDYTNLNPQFKLRFNNNANEFYHTVVEKFTARIDIAAYNQPPANVGQLYNTITVYNLPTLDLSQAAIIFPFDSLRYIDLKNF